MSSYHDDLNLYGVDFNHLRLSELVKLADQAEPFYLWAEKIFRQMSGRADSLEKIIRVEERTVLEAAILRCFESADESGTPKLFNGVGVPYPHSRACYFFFAWLIRDAATQRLSPLISKAFKHYKAKFSTRKRIELESEVFSHLLTNYRDELSFFSWPVVREVLISRLEGSRRAARGSQIELTIRTALAQSITYFYKVHGNYGQFIDVTIHEKPLKVNNRTYDVVAELVREDKSTQYFVLPVKTRETQGGGHAHLFTRDIEQANIDIRNIYPDALISPVVIAENWSENEKDLQRVGYDELFHFSVNPNRFAGFTDKEQIKLNRLVERILTCNHGE